MCECTNGYFCDSIVMLYWPMLGSRYTFLFFIANKCTTTTHDHCVINKLFSSAVTNVRTDIHTRENGWFAFQNISIDLCVQMFANSFPSSKRAVL